MGGYSYLSSVKDPGTAQALQHLMDTVKALAHRVETLEAQAIQQTGSQPVDARGQRVIRVANAQAGDDAVNLQTMRVYVQAQVSTFNPP